jgi:TRAP-type C4-dicarboxylate transport system permease small subunit
MAQKFIGKINKALSLVDSGLLCITGFALLFLTLMIFADVALRFIFNAPLPASAEATELIMPYIAFCSLAYTLFKGTHIRITLFTEHGSASTRMAFDIICSVFGLLCSAVFTYYSWLLFWNSLIINEQMAAIIKMSWWIGKFSMPLGFFFFTIRYLLNTIILCSGEPIKQ